LPCLFLEFRVFLGLNPMESSLAPIAQPPPQSHQMGLGIVFSILHCVLGQGDGWALKGCIKPYKKDNNMVKPMNFNFWPNEVMESHKMLHIGTISTPMFRKRDLHPPSPAPLYYWYH
jgi:hypothetical protein